MTNEETLVLKVQKASAKLEETLFKDWRKAQDVTERELIAAKAGVLNDLTFTLINNIRGHKDE